MTRGINYELINMFPDPAVHPGKDIPALVALSTFANGTRAEVIKDINGTRKTYTGRPHVMQALFSTIAQEMREKYRAGVYTIAAR